MPIDVSNLIDQQGEFKLKSASMIESGVNAELFLFLAETSKWDVFACLLGFAETEKKEIPEVLDEIPSNLEGGSDDWTLPFLSYSAAYKQSSNSNFLHALKSIKGIASASVLLNTSIVKIERCLREHPNDNEAFLRCLQE